MDSQEQLDFQDHLAAQEVPGLWDRVVLQDQ
jgi:hypothetical protein